MISIGVLDPNNCKFYLRSGSTPHGDWDAGIVYDGFPPPPEGYGIRYGPTPKGLVPIAGDWTGKGFDSIGAYRDSPSPIFCLRNSNEPGAADLEFAYGNWGDIPLVGNWRQKGFDCIGVYRKSEHKFYLRYSNTSGNADQVIQWGRGDGALALPGDLPLVGDWTGKGFDSLGVYHPKTRTFYLRHYKGYYPPRPETNDTVITYGNRGDVPVVGDWTGKGFDSIGVYRPSESKFYLRNSNTPGPIADIVIHYGNPGCIPLVGNWR
jgi:hypothetical protein